MFKRLVRGLGLPVVDWREVRAARWARDRDGVLAELEAFAAATGDPRLMVKPARLGSSVGMTLAHAPAERGRRARRLAFRYDDLALVERYLAGARDLEVAVIGNEPDRLELYGPGEIVAGHEFYDYAAKYTPGLSETSTSAEVTATQRAAMLKLARDAYRAVGREGFARVDFLLAGDELYLSEINTIPGFTPISLFPTLPAEAARLRGGLPARPRPRPRAARGPAVRPPRAPPTCTAALMRFPARPSAGRARRRSHPWRAGPRSPRPGAVRPRTGISAGSRGRPVRRASA